MDLRHLYTSLDGRINRQPYWIGTITLAMVNFVILFVVSKLLGVLDHGTRLPFQAGNPRLDSPVSLP